jgi:hypothetical protein
MLMNSDLHSTAPFMRTRHSMSSGERQRFDLQMAECGRYTESRLSGQEGTDFKRRKCSREGGLSWT